MIGVVRRDKRVILQSLTKVQTAEGETTESWSDVDTVWAKIEPLQAKEQWFARQSQATTTHRISLWYQDGIAITSRMRAVWKGRTFHFDSVLNVDEANKEIQILATEITE